MKYLSKNDYGTDILSNDLFVNWLTWLLFFKETVRVGSSDPPCIAAVSLKPFTLIKNVEDTERPISY